MNATCYVINKLFVQMRHRRYIAWNPKHIQSIKCDTKSSFCSLESKPPIRKHLVDSIIFNPKNTQSVFFSNKKPIGNRTPWIYYCDMLTFHFRMKWSFICNKWPMGHIAHMRNIQAWDAFRELMRNFRELTQNFQYIYMQKVGCYIIYQYHYS